MNTNTTLPLWDTFTEAKDPADPEPEPDDPLPDGDFLPAGYVCTHCGSGDVIANEHPVFGYKCAWCLTCDHTQPLNPTT
ncbi:MAG: hypothetical protein KA204_00255 [Chromatiaceae bacterium]|nr:hypothetical protein [Chromatiaceae bacterium]